MEKVILSRKPGDWSCRSCQYVNFCKRDACQRCGAEAKFGAERADYAAMGGSWEVKPGDWYCCCCGVNNYASRGSCFKCGTVKTDSDAVAQNWPWRFTWKSGDWICPSSPKSYYG